SGALRPASPADGCPARVAWRARSGTPPGSRRRCRPAARPRPTDRRRCALPEAVPRDRSLDPADASSDGDTGGVVRPAAQDPIPLGEGRTVAGDALRTLI